MTDVDALDWKTFVQDCVAMYDASSPTVRYEGFGEVGISAVTAVNQGLFNKAVAAGAPGIIIGVCDFSREALALSVNMALLDSLNGFNRLEYNLDSFKPGDILSLGNCNIKFQGVVHNDTLGRCISYVQGDWINTCRRCDAVPPLHKMPQGARVSGKKNRFSDALKDYESLSQTRKRYRDLSSLVDKPIGFVTSSSIYANVPPSKLGKGVVAYGKELIPLSECFPIDYVASDGSIKRSSAFGASGNPGIIVSNRTLEGVGDVFPLVEHVDNGGYLRCVVIEAPSAESVDGMYGSVRDLVDAGVPVAVICGEEVIRESETWEKLGLVPFVWTKGQLSRCDELTALGPCSLTKREAYRARRLTRLEAVADDGALSDIANVIYGIRSNSTAISEKATRAINSINRLYSTVLKQTELILEDVSESRIRTLEEAVGILCDVSNDCSLTSKEVRDLRAASEKLKYLLRPNYALAKEEYAYKVMKYELERGRGICLIAANEISSHEAQEYWVGVFAEEGFLNPRINALTPYEFLKGKGVGDGETAIVCGWFSREMMAYLTLSGLSDLYVILMYRGCNGAQLETDWFLRAADYWGYMEDRAKECSVKTLKLLGVKPEEGMGPSPKNKCGSPAVEDNSISAVVARAYSNQAAEQAAQPGEESRLARLVHFTTGKCRWLGVPDGEGEFSRGDALVVVECSENGEYDYCRKTAATLKAGDLVLRTDSDEDALEEACKKNFGSYEAALELAKRWYEPIRLARRSMSDSEILRRIQAAGSKKHDSTILSWIRGDISIAPNRQKDIVAINDGLGRILSTEDIKRIAEAIKVVKGRRISSGRGLHAEIAEHFIRDASELGVVRALSGFDKRHGLGAVELLRVEHVGQPVSVSVNRLGHYFD